MVPTFHTVSSDQGRAQRTERVKGLSQQPLLPIPLHLPITGADVIGHREPCHMWESILLLGREAHNECQCQVWTVTLGTNTDLVWSVSGPPEWPGRWSVINHGFQCTHSCCSYFAVERQRFCCHVFFLFYFILDSHLMFYRENYNRDRDWCSNFFLLRQLYWNNLLYRPRDLSFMSFAFV